MFTPSKYQSAVFDAVKNTTDNLGIRAVAGSGKSTTLEHAVMEIPMWARVLVLAFNRDIVTALKPRIKHPGAEVMTINAFGSRICRKQIRGIGDVDKDKTDKGTASFLDLEDRDQRRIYYKVKGSISRLVELFRANLIMPDDVNDSKICEVADQYGIELPDDKPEYFNLVQDVYQKCLSMPHYPDFRDQVFMPLYLNLEIPKYDVVLADESQDFDRNQMELILAAGRRFILVGDPNQAIYGFRGAMANAMEEMLQRINAKELPLSVCYRCPRRVVEQAKEIVPEIEWCDTAPEGTVETIKTEDFRKKAESGNFVLCRVTAPLVSECLRMIREGKKAMVKGREIGQQLITVIDKLSHTDDYMATEDFYRSLQRYHTEQLERLSRAEREEEIIALNDRVDTIKVLLEACKTVGEIKRRIESIFSDNVTGIIFMTCHKAKGLESTRVFILAPELLPHPAAKTECQQKQEKNLEYVAITRAKFDSTSDGELYFVKS